MAGRRDALAWLAVVALGAGPDAMAQAVNPRAVPTYEAVGLYWGNPPGNPTAGCDVRYRRAGDVAWKPGLTMWFDSASNECRGSLVGLAAGTDYEAELSVTSPSQTRSLAFKTWANQKPVKLIVPVLPGNGTVNITQGGNATEGYVVYQGVPAGAVIDVANAAPYNVTINASYVIVRGLVLRGAQQHAILVSPNATDVIIEDNEITGWGRQRIGSTFGVDLDSAIRAICSSPTLERVTIQRNEIHDPRYGANSWSSGHPAGPQAITFSFCGGNHVIRHNEIYSSGNYFNDVIGGEDNFSTTGFPNADSDIYGNELSNSWDDGIEAEGGNRNVRIWGNYLDSTATGIATTVTSVGPAYIFRNVWNRNRFYDNLASDSDDRQPFFKAGSDSTLGNGRRYVFHNTMLQVPPPPGTTYPLGGGGGISGTGNSQLVQNTITRNNIFHIWKDWWTVYYQSATSGNTFERDLYNGVPGATVTNGINATPVYQAGNGPASGAGGQYALAPGTRGYDEGVRINNFNDDYLGTAPDVGAHEAGSPAMRFGPAASPGSAFPPQPTPAFVSAASVKSHATLGSLAVPLDASQPVNGAVSIEMRQGASGHKLVFTFNTSIWYPGTVSSVDDSGAPLGSASASAAGATVEVTLAALPDARRVRVTLTNVNNTSTTVGVSAGFLAGDVNGSRAVTAADILRVKGRIGQAVTASNGNHVYDIDLNGVIDANDLAAVKANSGREL